MWSETTSKILEKELHHFILVSLANIIYLNILPNVREQILRFRTNSSRAIFWKKKKKGRKKKFSQFEDEIKKRKIFLILSIYFVFIVILRLWSFYFTLLHYLKQTIKNPFGTVYLCEPEKKKSKANSNPIRRGNYHLVRKLRFVYPYISNHPIISSI